MDVKDFYNNFKELGERYLAPGGWVYKYKMWHYTGDGVRLSFIPVTTKFGRGFQIKHLTLTLVHTRVTPPEDLLDKHKKNFSNNDKYCPAQIAPDRLKLFVEGKFSRWIWHYVHPRESNLSHEYAYTPIYYGGENRRLLEDPDATEKENRKILLEFLKTEGIKYVEEEKALAAMEKAFEHVSLFARKWVEFMTPRETMKQLIFYGGWWIDKEWLTAYEKEFGKIEVRLTVFDRIFKKIDSFLMG
jgi:hypothetical protein